MRGMVCKCAAAALGVAMTASTAIAGGATRPLEALNPLDYAFSTNTSINQWFRGYEFVVNGDNVTATEIGIRLPTANQVVTVELWDNNSQTLLASVANVNSLANEWLYVSIPSVPLANGGRYTVGALSPGTNADYFFKNALPPEWYPSGVINYQTMRFHNNATSGFPTSVLAGYQYGVVDIGYVIPAPGAAALLGLGMAFGSRRRRRA